MSEFESRVTQATSSYDGGEASWELTVYSRRDTVQGRPVREISPETLPLHILEALRQWAADGIAEYAGDPT